MRLDNGGRVQFLLGEIQTGKEEKAPCTNKSAIES